jgi:hypothetical protein
MSHADNMIRLYVDFNSREDVDVIIVRIGPPLNTGFSKSDLRVGDHVLLNDETMECVARLRKGTYSEWVADIIPGTIKDIPEELWERFRTHD